MAFSLIVPPPKVKTGSFKISTVRMRDSSPFRLQLSMPSAIYTQHFGAAERLDVQLGNGVDEGMMLLQPAENGHFRPTFMKAAVILRLPTDLDWPPQFKIEAADPEFRKANGGGMLVTLPEWAWSKERQKSILAARNQVARERAADR